MRRETEIEKATVIGGIGNILLTLFKFVAGIWGHSSAMIADAVHSLSDLITDIIILVFVHISAKPQDDTHRYGHGKFETLASFLVGLALVAAAIGIMVAGASKLIDWHNGAQLPSPTAIALWAALLSIAVKEILYRYTKAQARKTDSQVMVANAWHHRSDALSSVAAAIGVGGAMALGDRWTMLDPLMSIVVSLMLLRVAYSVLKNSVGELTESALPKEEEQEILSIILSQPEISDPHNLRTRHIGHRIAIEAHIRMDGNTTINEAHRITHIVQRLLRDRFGDDTIVSLHVEAKKDG